MTGKHIIDRLFRYKYIFMEILMKHGSLQQIHCQKMNIPFSIVENDGHLSQLMFWVYLICWTLRIFHWQLWKQTVTNVQSYELAYCFGNSDAKCVFLAAHSSYYIIPFQFDANFTFVDLDAPIKNKIKNCFSSNENVECSSSELSWCVCRPSEKLSIDKSAVNCMTSMLSAFESKLPVQVSNFLLCCWLAGWK